MAEIAAVWAAGGGTGLLLLLLPGLASARPLPLSRLGDGLPMPMIAALLDRSGVAGLAAVTMLATTILLLRRARLSRPPSGDCARLGCCCCC